MYYSLCITSILTESVTILISLLNQKSCLSYTTIYYIVNNNLIGSRPPRVKELRKNVIKRKKKAKFELPHIDTVKSLPSIRHERRISPDFVPIFDINEIPVTSPPEVKTTTTAAPPPRPRVSSLPLRMQPRGEGQQALKNTKEIFLCICYYIFLIWLTFESGVSVARTLF